MLDPGLLTKEWFRRYRSTEKLAFITLLCVCDEIGVWTIDVEWAEMLTGCRVDWKALVEGSNGNIIILDERHVLIPDYFRFQYPRASRNNPIWSKLYKRADDSPHRHLLSLPNLQTVDTSVVSQSPIPRYQGGTSVVRKEEEKEKVSLSSGVREDSSEDRGDISKDLPGAPHSSSKRLRPGVFPQSDECPDCFKLGWGTPMTRLYGVLNCPVHGDPDRERGGPV